MSVCPQLICFIILYLLHLFYTNASLIIEHIYIDVKSCQLPEQTVVCSEVLQKADLYKSFLIAGVNFSILFVIILYLPY